MRTFQSVASPIVDRHHLFKIRAGLECTLDGPEIEFLGAAVVAMCGAPMEITVDGKETPMWTRIPIKPGQRLRVGKSMGGGCRSYLAVYGGLPSVAEWFGSKATSPGVGVGGYQGRQLASGDLLAITKDIPGHLSKPLKLPERLIPQYPNHWDLLAMAGPYDEGFLLQEDVEMIYNTEWRVSHNAARGGIRLIGPKPKWARSDGGEGGAHPSNVPEYGYPVGSLNWTGDDPCLFPVDCPDFGGFVSSTTIIKAEYWRMGQMKAGDTMKILRVSLEDALVTRRRGNKFIDDIGRACSGNYDFAGIEPLDYSNMPTSMTSNSFTRICGKAIVRHIEEEGSQPRTLYRQVINTNQPIIPSAYNLQGGDDYLLVEYGDGRFDLNHRCRVTALAKALKDANSNGPVSGEIINTVGCCNSELP